MGKRKRVSTVVVVDQDKFLILQRSKTSSNSGSWNFPGGSIEDGESDPIAGARELKEEADIDVDSSSLEYIGKIVTKRLEINFFITDKFEGSVSINEESDDWRWVSIDDLPDFKFVGGGSIHRGILSNIESFMSR